MHDSGAFVQAGALCSIHRQSDTCGKLLIMKAISFALCAILALTAVLVPSKAWALQPTPDGLQDLSFVSVPAKPALSVLDSTEVECLAKNMYFEARGEGEKGMVAVGYVVLNRMKDDQWGKTACAVVHEGKRTKSGKPVLHACQFAWTCDGKSDRIVNQAQYNRATELAKLVLLRVAPNPIGKATYFHQARVSRDKQKYAFHRKVGNHLFYALAAR